MAKYTEESEPYVRNMDRLLRKWETIKTYMPKPEFPVPQEQHTSEYGMIYFGTSEYSSVEAADMFAAEGMQIDLARLRSFPFDQSMLEFINDHAKVFVVEQNRDAQMRSLLINELNVDPMKLVPVLNYDGLPITAQFIYNKIADSLGYSSSSTNYHDLHQTRV